jgi:hypothetical protein
VRPHVWTLEILFNRASRKDRGHDEHISTFSESFSPSIDAHILTKASKNRAQGKAKFDSSGGIPSRVKDTLHSSSKERPRPERIRHCDNVDLSPPQLVTSDSSRALPLTSEEVRAKIKEQLRSQVSNSEENLKDLLQIYETHDVTLKSACDIHT